LIDVLLKLSNAIYLKTIVKRINERLSPGHLYYGPEWLVLGVNNICNLHCKMCDVGLDFNQSNFYTNLVGTDPMHMPIELIKQIMDETVEHFPKTKLGYAFTEPLVYKHLEESLAYATKLGLHTSVTTNALTLRQKSAGILEAGLNSLYISLDGPPEIHNMIRGHKSSFQRAIEGIEAMLASPKCPEIEVYCVITEWNIGHLEEFLDIFKKYPLKQIGFMHTNFTHDELADNHNLVYGSSYPATASNIEEIDITKMDLDVLYEEIQAILAADYPWPVSWSPNAFTKEELHKFYHKPEELWGKRCNDAFSNIMIKSDGSVIPAHGRCYNVSIGNIYDQNLKQLWNSTELARFRKTLNKAGGLLPACSRCCSAF
jgi:radical SAM protein with 4Fe4S-binding SPASM domain